MLLLLPAFLAVLTSALLYFFRRQSTLWLVIISFLQIAVLVVSWAALTNLQIFVSIVLIGAFGVLQILFAQSRLVRSLAVLSVSLWLFFLQALFSTVLIWWWVLLLLVWFTVVACRYCLRELPSAAAYIFAITAGLSLLEVVSMSVLSALGAALLAGFVGYLLVIFVLANTWWWRQVAWFLFQSLTALVLLTVFSSSSQVATLLFVSTAMMVLSLGFLLGNFFDLNQQADTSEVVSARVIKSFWISHLLAIWSLPPLLTTMSFFLVLTQLLQFGLAWTAVFILITFIITALLTMQLLPQWQTKIKIKPKPYLYLGAGILVVALLILPLTLPDQVITFLQTVLPNL